MRLAVQARMWIIVVVALEIMETFKETDDGRG